MPYSVSKSGSGYKVRNRESGKTYSKHAQSHTMAVRQLRAIEMRSGAEDGRKS
jgi:hypothetical protein